MLVVVGTVAVGVVVAHGVALARRGSTRWWPAPVAAAAAAGMALGGGGDREVLAAAVALVVAVAVWAFRTRTRLGLATAALASDPRSVAVLGRSPRLATVAHVVAGTLGAAVGGALAPSSGAALGAAAAGAAAVVVRGRPRRRRPDRTRPGSTQPSPLAVDHAVVRDGGAVVLDGLTVPVEAGAGGVGVVGPTGAGKSTLVALVAGALAPDEGEVRVEGRVGRSLDEPAAVVVLDEPSAGLDADAAASLRERIRGVAERGGTVLLAEHDMDFAFLTCDRIVAIDRGAAVAAGTPEDVRVHPAVVAAYLGRRLDEVVP